MTVIASIQQHRSDGTATRLSQTLSDAFFRSNQYRAVLKLHGTHRGCCSGIRLPVMLPIAEFNLCAMLRLMPRKFRLHAILHFEQESKVEWWLTDRQSAESSERFHIQRIHTKLLFPRGFDHLKRHHL